MLRAPLCRVNHNCGTQAATHTVAPAPQRHLVIVQAGASDDGRELAAATADVVYCLYDSVEAPRREDP